jgi:hypothetical protein
VAEISKVFVGLVVVEVVVVVGGGGICGLTFQMLSI